MKIPFRKILFLSLVICSCGGRTQQDENLLKEAASVHNEMVASAEALEEKLEVLQMDTIQMIPIDSIMAWKNAIKAWEAELVEVPGNEAHHHKEHEHHHEKAPDVTPGQMLVIQKELKAQLENIIQRIEKK